MSGTPQQQQNQEIMAYEQQPQYVQQQPNGQPQVQYVQYQGGQPVQYVQQPVQYVQQPMQYGGQPVYVQQQPVQVIQTQTVMTTDGQAVGFQSSSIQGEAGEFDCGTSTYGLRMDFKSRQYRDIPFLVLWICAMIIWVILLIAFSAGIAKRSKNSSNNTTTTSSNSTTNTAFVNAVIGRTVGAFIILCFVGVLCGYMWLHLMFRYAKSILKFLIGLKLLCMAILAIFFFILSFITPVFIVYGVICAIVLAVYCLYYWWIRNRLKLAAAMIRLGTKVIQTNQATIGLQFLTSCALFFWWLEWIVVLVLYFLLYNANGFVVILMIFMGNWTVDVLEYIAHVTTCGVTAVWWFSKDRMKNPTWNSYKFATTRGLGSICCGAMLVAIVQTIRSKARQNARNGSAGGFCCFCCAACLEWLVRYFSSYAFCQVAIYGVSYWQAAKNTFQLFSSKGIDALINDNLSHTVLAAGAIVGGVLTSIIGGILGYVMFINYGKSPAIIFALVYAVIGWYIGFYFTRNFMHAVHSSIESIFVMWAEDPMALQITHPACFALLSSAWAKVTGRGDIREDIELD